MGTLFTISAILSVLFLILTIIILSYVEVEWVAGVFGLLATIGSALSLCMYLYQQCIYPY